MTSPRPTASRWWILTGAVLLACAYLPTLSTPFDMIDDGTLVYAEPPMPLGERLEVGWGKVVANYEELGPFRPTLWAHWEIAAEIAQGDPFIWRSLRLLWLTFAAAMFLWLLHELGIHPAAALLAVAVAMWNRYRNEIWTSLTLSEGVAMPYAILSLVAAVRASRSHRPWHWDLVGVLCMLTALGCKNTFAALIPAQLWLRMMAGVSHWREGIKKNAALRAAILSVSLLLPIGHYIYFKTHWQPGQYKFEGASLAQLGRILRSFQGAVALEMLALGLILALVAMRKSAKEGNPPPAWRPYQMALITGLLVMLGGIVVYLPVGVMSGRYTMPGVWGLDICLAIFFTMFLQIPYTKWKRAAIVGLTCGLVGIVIANVGKQQKFSARAKLLWQALHRLEKELPREACVGWVSRPQLSVLKPEDRAKYAVPGRYLGYEEGLHFLWHLQRRGRADLHVATLDPQGNILDRQDYQSSRVEPNVYLTEEPVLPEKLKSSGMTWSKEEVIAKYWAGLKQYRCYIWRPVEGSARK